MSRDHGISADLTDLTWHKSSYSGGQGNCVEVADLPGMLLVRDSKDPDGPVLTFSRDAWTAFLDHLR